METMRKTLRRKLVWFFAIGAVIAPLLVGVSINIAVANNLYSPPPTGTAYFVYVPDSYFTDPSLAYTSGRNIRVGGTHRVIILDFGRQWQNPTTGNWGVQLIRQGTIIRHSMGTVSWVAQSFINGYNDSVINGYNQAAYVAIGINNGNWNWTCSENDPNSVDSRWFAAGGVWGSMINSLMDRPGAIVKSANDIEAWNIDGWRPCGYGTLFWFYAYTYQTTRNNYHFGSEPYNDNPYRTPVPGAPTPQGGWQKSESVALANGFSAQARVVPEIYCSAANAAPWVTIKNYAVSQNLAMRFDGVTSLNSTTGPCNPSLDYSHSWSNLNTALQNANYFDILSNVTISYHAPIFP